jgi:hypothetical protein
MGFNPPTTEPNKKKQRKMKKTKILWENVVLGFAVFSLFMYIISIVIRSF